MGAAQGEEGGKGTQRPAGGAPLGPAFIHSEHFYLECLFCAQPHVEVVTGRTVEAAFSQRAK